MGGDCHRICLYVHIPDLVIYYRPRHRSARIRVRDHEQRRQGYDHFNICSCFRIRPSFPRAFVGTVRALNNVTGVERILHWWVVILLQQICYWLTNKVIFKYGTSPAVWQETLLN